MCRSGSTPVEGSVARRGCFPTICNGNEDSVLAFDRDLDLLLSEAGHAFSGGHDGHIHCSLLWSGLQSGVGRGFLLGSGGTCRWIWNDRKLVTYGCFQI